MLTKLVAGAVLIQASLGVGCNSLNEEQKCQDPLKPCLETNIGECVPENGPGCSGGSELIYCPAIAVRDNIGRCGFKGCHEGSCVHNDPNIGACYPSKSDSTCDPGTTKCETLAPTSAPITSITLKKCAIGLGPDLDRNMKLYIYDLTEGTRYEWGNVNLGKNYASATALDHNSDVLYTFMNTGKRIIGYDIYTKQEILNKEISISSGIHIEGMDFNENDGYIYGAGCRVGDPCRNSNIYRFTTSGEYEVVASDVAPRGTVGFLFSKDYTSVYYAVHRWKIYKAPISNYSDWKEIYSNTPIDIHFDTIDWYTNDPDDETLLLCVTDYDAKCVTYNIQTNEEKQLFHDSRWYLLDMEVLYDEFENCEYALSTCPIKIDVKESSECTVIIKVLSSDCGCTNNIEYIEMTPSNISPIKLTQPSWEEETGNYWLFCAIFEGPFSIKIGKTGKELFEANIFDLNDKNIYEIQGNLCE